MHVSVTKFSPVIFSPVLIPKHSVVVLVECTGLLVTDLIMECKYLFRFNSLWVKSLPLKGRT